MRAKKIVNNIKKNTFWGNLFRNSFWAFIGDAVSSAIGIVIAFILIKAVGNESYGILILGQTYMQIADVLINVQSWKGVIQYGQKALVQKKINDLHAYVKLGSILDISTAILCGVLAILFAPIIGNFFGWSQELICCAQISSITIFTHFSGTPTGILRLLDKFSLVAIQKFISAIIKLSTILLCLCTGNINIISLTIAYVAADSIGNILLILFALIEYRKKFKLTSLINGKLPNKTKGFISFTLWGTFSEIVDIPVNYLDVFIVSLLGEDKVAIFKTFKQFASVLQKVSSPIQQSILPQFSQLSAEGKQKNGYTVVKKIRSVTIKILLPISLLIGISSPIWLNIFYGEEYSNEWYTFCVYILVQALALSYTTIHPYFLSLGQAKRSTLYILLANIAYLALSYLLIQYVGLIGMAIAFLVQVELAIGLKRKYIKYIQSRRI